MGFIVVMMCLLVGLSGYCGWVTGGVIGYFTVGVAIAFFLTMLIEGAFDAGKKVGMKIGTKQAKKEEDINGIH